MLTCEESYKVMKVMVVQEVMACDVWPVAMFHLSPRLAERRSATASGLYVKAQLHVLKIKTQLGKCSKLKKRANIVSFMCVSGNREILVFSPQ